MHSDFLYEHLSPIVINKCDFLKKLLNVETNTAFLSLNIWNDVLEMQCLIMYTKK